MIAHHKFLNHEIDVKWVNHCGGSFKMSLQTVKTANQNSKDIIISIFEAKDYRINILVGLQRFTKQVKYLQEISWRR